MFEIVDDDDGRKPNHGYTISSPSTQELKNWLLAYAKIKALISCAVTAQLISAYVFAT